MLTTGQGNDEPALIAAAAQIDHLYLPGGAIVDFIKCLIPLAHSSLPPNGIPFCAQQTN